MSEGYYMLVDKNAITEPHAIFYQWINEEDFLSFSLKCFDTDSGQIKARPINEAQCSYLSNFLNLHVRCYEFENKMVYYTPELMNADEIKGLLNGYLKEIKTGVRAQLKARKNINMKDDIQGKILHGLKNNISMDGKTMTLSFPEYGNAAIPILQELQSYYTTPLPGNFHKIEINSEFSSIIFYL